MGYSAHIAVSKTGVLTEHLRAAESGLACRVGVLRKGRLMYVRTVGRCLVIALALVTLGNSAAPQTDARRRRQAAT